MQNKLLDALFSAKQERLAAQQKQLEKEEKEQQAMLARQQILR